MTGAVDLVCEEDDNVLVDCEEMTVELLLVRLLVMEKESRKKGKEKKKKDATQLLHI